MLDKLKALSKETLIYGSSTIIGRFLTFLLVPLYTNVFPAADYGVIANMFAIIAILNVFFSIGLESGYFKFASTLEIGNAKQNFSLPFIIILLNSFVFCGLMILFSDSLSELFLNSSSYGNIVIYSAVILFFDAAVLVPFASLRLSHRPVYFAVFKVLNIIINFGLNLYLILVLRWGIESIFLANCAASILTFIFFIPLIIKNFSFKIPDGLLKELFMFSLPIIPAGIAANLLQVIDRPILFELTDQTTVGLYQANYRLGIFMMLLVSMFEFAWRPFFLNNAKLPNAKNIFAKVLTFFTAAASIVFLLFSFFIEYIVKIPIPGRGYLIGEAYWSGLGIVPVILAAYLFYGMYVNFTAGIYIEKKTKYLPLITILAAIAKIALNFLLIPVLGIFGSAFAALGAYILLAVLMYYYSSKTYKVNYEFPKIIVFLSISFLLCLVSYFVFENTTMELIFKVTALSAYLLFIYRFILRDFKTLNI